MSSIYNTPSFVPVQTLLSYGFGRAQPIVSSTNLIWHIIKIQLSQAAAPLLFVFFLTNTLVEKWVKLKPSWGGKKNNKTLPPRSGWA